MRFRFKGYGWWVWPIVLGAFILFRLLFETFSSGSEDALWRHVNGAVLATSGVVIFLIAMRADRKNGIEVFSRRAWTLDIFESSHISFSIPMRLFGVVLFSVSLFF